MKFSLVLAVLLSVLGKAFSYGVPPAVSTIYSGAVAPAALWSDADGNIYGCEPDFHSVFKVDGGGNKFDFAGTRGTSGVATEGVLAANALFNTPRTVWGDDQFLYVTDSVNNRIRRISWATSLITTIVGGGAGAILTSGEFLGTSVALTLPNAIAGSSSGKVYFADFGHIYLLVPETGMVGMVSFIAGGGDRIGTFAHGDQVALSDVQGLAVDPTNQFLFVADSGNKVVRKMDLTTGQSIIFAGRAKKEHFQLPSTPFKNGETAHKVKLGNPSSVWVNQDGHVFITDSHFHTISVVRHNKIFLFAGNWSAEAIASPLTTGPANQVNIEASHIFGDSSKGVLYLSDKTRGGIQKITSLAVNAYEALITKTNIDSSLIYPQGIWVDAVGNVYVVDGVFPVASSVSNLVIWKMSPSGVVSIFAGKKMISQLGIPGDGGLATEAEFFEPRAIWGDTENLYVIDYDRIRAINFATNVITTVAGGGGGGSVSTTPKPATGVNGVSLGQIYGLWGDGKGKIYISTRTSVYLYSVSAGTVQRIAYAGGIGNSNVNDIPLLDLKVAVINGNIAGDATRNCLYVSEGAAVNSPLTHFLPPRLIRKLDLNTGISTIFAGRFGIDGTASDQYTDGAIATTVAMDPGPLWVADDGTVFVSHNGIISAIDPVSQRMTWVAGLYDNGDNQNNPGVIGGLAKLGQVYPCFLAGNSAVNKLYFTELDPNFNVAVRLISPISAFLASPSRRRLEEEEQISLELNELSDLQTGTSNLRGSV
jgi:sugar lactone lactonase YvrE